MGRKMWVWALNVPLLLNLGCVWIYGDLKRSEHSLSCSGTPYNSGSGTTADPYIICSKAQWKQLVERPQDWSSQFKLAADIDFVGVAAADVAVGTSGQRFTGGLDGGGYSVKNFAGTASGSNAIALFAYVGTSTFSNLTVQGFSVAGTNDVALLVARASGASVTISSVTLQNSSVSGNVASNVAGLVANATSGTVSIDSSRANTVSITAPTSNSAGVLVGSVVTSVTVTNTQVRDSTFSGGLMGNSGCLVGNVYSAGASHALATIVNSSCTNVSGSAGPYGGLIGYADSSVIQSSSVTGTLTSSGFANVGGLIGSAWHGTGGGSTHSITQSSFQGTLNCSSSGYCGGIVAVFETGLSLDRVRTNFLMNAPVAASGRGGFVGMQLDTNAYVGMTASIVDSSAEGTLTVAAGTNYAGGFMGRVRGNTTVTLTRSYAAVTITNANAFIRCIAGINSGTVNATDVYYDDTLCTHTNAIAGVTAQNTLAMQPAVAFTNFLTSVWSFSAGSYPSLIGL